MMIQPTTRAGLTLVELIAALVIAAAVTAIGIAFLRPVSDTGKQRSCDLTRQLLQNDAQRYVESTGRMPRSDLRELQTDQFSGTVLPSCPVTGQSYRLSRTGTVGCPTHEATRSK